VILRAEQLIETLAETVGEAYTNTHCDPLHDAKVEVKIDALGGVEARKLLKTRTDTVVKVETRTVVDIFGLLKAKALINTPDDALA